MRIKTITAVLAMASAIFMTGCAPLISGAMNATTTDESIKEKTAKYFATTTDKVKISHINKSLLDTSYRAQVGKNIHVCNIYFGDVNCPKVDQ